MTLSAVIVAQPREDARRCLGAGRQRQRIRKVREIGLSRNQVTRGSQALERIVGDGRQDGDRAAAVGYLDALAILDPAQQLTRPLSKLSYAYARHVLLVARIADVANAPPGAS